MALDELEATAAEQSALHRTAARGLREVQLACAADVPGRLAALAAQRVRELVDPDGGPHELSDWPTAPDLTPLERAALAFTEQFVIDVNGLTDEVVAPLTSAMTRTEVYLLGRVVQAAEARLRAGMVLRYEPQLADVVAELRSPVGAR
jgi:alkylhydroperoxidase family enzyme